MLLGYVVPGRGEGGLLPRPGVLHGGVGDGHGPTASHFSLEQPEISISGFSRQNAFWWKK